MAQYGYKAHSGTCAMPLSEGGARYLWGLALSLLLLLFERVLHAVCVLLWHVMHSSPADLRVFAAGGVLAGCVQGLAGVLLGAVAVATTALGALINAGRWVVQIVLLGLLFTLLFEYYPQFVEDAIRYYNDGFGSGLRAYVFEPLRLVHLAVSVVLPAYNAIAYTSTKMITTVLVPGLALDFDADAALQFFGALADLLRDVTLSLSKYVLTFSACTPEAGSACFEPGLRMLDLLTPMADVRAMAAAAVRVVSFNCALLATPVDLVAYPLMDINLAKGVHALANAALLGVLQVPLITYERCRLRGANSSMPSLDVLLCVPDFEPAWNAFSSGQRFLGRAIDNWLNIALVIVEEAVTGSAPSCAAPPLGLDVAAPDSSLFGGNATAVAGLTESMYAVTDGLAAQYTLFAERAVERVLVPGAWPMQVQVAHGIAAVQYSDAEPDTTAMLGCRCDDVVDTTSPSGARLALACAIAPYDAGGALAARAADYVLPLEFQLPSTAFYMTCAQVQIAVQSVRWPLSRSAKPDAASGALRDAFSPLGATSSGASELDAAVFVVPRCGSGPDNEPDIGCLQTFRDAACYPYCIAGRPRGARNSALVLHDADDWEEHVQLLRRDCGLGTITAAGMAAGGDFALVPPGERVPADYAVRYDTADRTAGVPIATGAPGAIEACQYDVNVASRVARAVLPAYAELGASVRLGEQPFVVAGDAALFVQWEGRNDSDPANDRAFVSVQRLIGAEAGQFTLWTLPERIPAHGACATAADCSATSPLPPGLITVPRAYARAAPPPAAATKWSVLYAVNPDADIYAAFFAWCAGDVNVGTQFQIDSAYGPIRIWRVDAFLAGGAVAAQMRRDDVVAQLAAFDKNVSWEACAAPANLSATALAYINEYNVAVTVLRASPRWYDTVARALRPGAPVGAEAGYDVYYLNPQTMRLRRDDLWQEERPVSVLAQGHLCPALRRAPQIGALLAEAAVATSVLVRFPLTLIVTVPALAPAHLRFLRSCPLVTRGHTMLRECGVNILSLAYYWEAVTRGNELAWLAVASAGTLLSGSTAATVLSGVTWLGREAPDPITGLGIVAAARHTVVRMLPVHVKVLLTLGTNLMRWVYELFAELLFSLLALDASSGIINQKAAKLVLWDRLHAMRLRYDELVTASALRACTGVGLLLGWANPYAQLAKSLCDAGALAVPAAYNVLDVVFVYYPLLACMCAMPAGADLQATVADTCFAEAPAAFRPLLADVVARGSRRHRGMCIEMGAASNDALQHAPDALFAVLQGAARGLEDTVDYLLAAFGVPGSSSQGCTDYAVDPYVMVLMPTPIDYFRMCGRTDTCRARCGELFAAFEAARDRGPAPRTESLSMLVERPFMTEDDILQRHTLPPFATVLALIEHPTCTTACGGAAAARCFSAVGIAASELLSVAAFCVTRDAGLRDAVRWSVAGSTAWTPRLLDARFLHEDEDDRTLLALRADGLVLCRPAGEVVTLVSVLADAHAAFYTVSARTLNAVQSVYVLPAHGSDLAHVVVHGTARRQRFEAETVLEPQCLDARVDLGSLTPLAGVYYSPCGPDSNLREVAGTAELVVAHDLNGANRALLVPTEQGQQLRLCKLDRDLLRLDACVALGSESGLLYNAATMLSSFRASVAQMFVLSREGVTARRADALSQTAATAFTAQTGGADQLVLPFFKTDNAATSGAWLSDVRVLAPTDLSRVLYLEARQSTSVHLALSVQRSCSVMSCSGCSGAATQKLCYAAQQCAIARCVGSTVHMHRPACMLGISLRDRAESVLAVTQAAWLVAYELLRLIVDASTGTVEAEVAVSFPFDALDIVVCDMKDVIVALLGTVMSLVNTLLLLPVQLLPDELYATANEINAASTLAIASLTNLFAHLCYVVFYAYFASYQMFACGTNSVLAVFDVTGSSVRLTPGEGWDTVGGQCVTKIVDESLSDFGAGGTPATLLDALNDMQTTLTKAGASLPLDMQVHTLDASITWALGVVHALQDLLQVVDTGNCRLPDASAALLGTCACGDVPGRVPAGDAGLLASGFWCAGTLRMVLSDGSARIVFNPYSLEELRVLAAGSIDAYLACISGDADGSTCHDLEPRDPLGLLEQQGVSLLAVLARCRGNYVARQWDDGSALLFAPERAPDLSEATRATLLRMREAYSEPLITACMLEALAEGAGTDRCLDLLLQLRGLGRSEYFALEPVAADSTQADIDACEVFSGPAASGLPKFAACVANDAECQLPYFLWSGRSANRVPVAAPHMRLGGAGRLAEAAALLAAARTRALRALDAFLASWDGAGLQVSLFTSEGDALHQALDCMVMGPYAAADLWPSGALPGVRFSRRSDPDELSREFELPCTGERLQGDSRPPFTCGSAARRAIMKFFVRDGLGDPQQTLGAIVRNETRALVTRLRAAWDNTSGFGCPCTITTAMSLDCCSATDAAGWTAFLAPMGRDKKVPGSDLTGQLMDDLAALLRGPLLHNTRDVVERHRTSPPDAWTAEEALLAADLGLLRLHDPVVRFDASEANAPFSANQSLFDLCVSHVAGTIFTLPLVGGGREPDPTTDGAEGFLSALERYVRTEALARAETHGPLFRQHVLRHVPSDSQVCLGQRAPLPNATRPLGLQAVELDERLLADAKYELVRNNLGGMLDTMADLQGATGLLQFLGAYYHSFAALDERCACGWRDADDGSCFLPATVCATVLAVFAADERFARLRAACAGGGRALYSPRTDFWAAHRAVAAGADSSGCPDLAPSDAWGVLGPELAAQWIEAAEIAHPQVRMLDVLRDGRGGLRAGNLFQTLARGGALLHPARRHKPVVYADGSSVAQPLCAAEFPSRLHPQLLERYADELFPVAQGVRTSMGVEACTRYALELALHEARRLGGATDDVDMRSWRRRCRAQLEVVAMCRVRGVFESTPADQGLAAAADCPFTVWDITRFPAVYLTRTCLLYADGAFYDVCLCEDCAGKSYSVAFVKACPLPLDVRALTRGAGGGFRWPSELGANETAARAALQALLAAEEQPALDGAALLRDAFDAPRLGAFNTPPVGRWFEAEGFSAKGAAHHCDSVADWWPEDWQQPVGYHVSPPPFADEAAYRVFDNAFAVDRGADGVVLFVYEHDALRNETLARNYFGASGLCGAHSYGAQMHELNTVRTCTRTSRDDNADPAVPLRAARTPGGSDKPFFDEACAADGSVPWAAGEGGFNARASTGLIAHWPDNIDENWPDEALPRLAPLADGLGAECFLPQLAVCATDADCEARSLAPGRVPLRCLGGVCAVTTQFLDSRFECVKHADCSAANELCSGFGECVQAVLQLTNRLDVAVEAQVFGDACHDNEREAMRGASPWDTVERLLPDSGFCSYRAWYEHRDLMYRGCAGALTDCKLPAREIGLQHSAISGDMLRRTLWDENVLRVGAHVCDRDYMHVEGMAACSPQAATQCRTAAGAVCTAGRGRITRTIDDRDRVAVQVGAPELRMPYGFLGLSITNSTEEDLRFCYDIPQCHLPRFTVNGFQLRERLAQLPGDASARAVSFSDYFTCGAFGLKTSDTACRLDPAVTPLFHVLCGTSDAARTIARVRDRCPWAFAWPSTAVLHDTLCKPTVVNGLLRPVSLPNLPLYKPEETAAVAEHLNWLLSGSIRPGFDSLAAYRNLSSCADALWAARVAAPELQGPEVLVWESQASLVRPGIC